MNPVTSDLDKVISYVESRLAHVRSQSRHPYTAAELENVLTVARRLAALTPPPTVDLPPPPQPSKRGLGLTDRQCEVIQGMSEGKDNGEIARDLVLSVETVRTHAKTILRKLGARNRTHAVALAIRQGLVS
ncbi:response regulator transcription factor [Amycolatopsis anabasis]|uniref:response regulator transcription factor n=1 Tax=Amycolatopsis anabasis TaxID=1840409 RepID=UPI00248460E9|nr:LuxR C-terminal-related transcriptional regulator [Amycolatopsis anabasis]